jgi:site-specific DNA-methyltransferase (cytosine-N4-specific)
LLELNTIHNMDCLEGLKLLPDELVDTCVTSPPYWGLRDYGIEGQIGIEETVEEYVSNIVKVMREVKRVLKNDGTLWLNIGDCYATQPAGNKKPSGFSQTRPSRQKHGIGTETVDIPVKRKFTDGVKLKDLVGVPWRVAFALPKDGWYLRSEIIWDKIHPMPESVKDRPTVCHEHIFLLTKNKKYYYDNEAIKEDTVDGSGKRNKRTIWRIWKKPFKMGTHFATFPEELIEPCILAGSRKNGIVLDPFMGAGTTAVVAMKHNRQYIGFELNPEYIEIANKRIEQIKK